MAPRVGKFELFQSEKSEKYYFRLKASNGEIILASQGYKQKAGAENGIQSVRDNAANAERFDKKESANGHPYFVLKAANGQVIGTSEMYESGAASRDHGIESVAKNAPEAKVVDLTTHESDGETVKKVETEEPEKKKARRLGKFEIFQSAKSEKFYFRLKAGNGEIILASQAYAQKSGAENGVESVRANAAKPEQFEKKDNKNGDPYFVLKAGNGEIIGTSEMYESGAASRDHGIEAVAKNAPDAKLVDLTA